MGLLVTLQHTKKLADGRYRYRRRYPEDVREALGWEFIRISADPLSDKAMHRWHLDREAEFETLVAGQRRLSGDPKATAMELQEVATERAAAMLAGVHGLEEDEAREVFAESVAAKYPEEPETGDRTGFSTVDKALINALMQPDAPSPAPTVADVKRLYTAEKAGDPSTERGRKRRNDIDRVFRLVEEALGARAKLPLTALRDADARAVRDHMLSRSKSGKAGETVKASSVRRELNVLSAAWKVALKGFDLNQGAKAVNIFEGLNISQEEVRSQQADRDPLPHAVIAAMWTKLHTAREKDGGRLPVLRLVWRLLAGTGCRVSEIAGLRLKDVTLAGDHPHIKVTWHDDRRVKNRASIRCVPLVGDALDAANEAVRLAGKRQALFDAYFGLGGGARLSAALMKHLSGVRAGDAPDKQVLHSLRHNMADWLRLSRVETRTENLILGHALGGVGSRVYGGSAADLELTSEAMKAAHARAEKDMGTTIAGGPLPCGEGLGNGARPSGRVLAAPVAAVDLIAAPRLKSGAAFRAGQGGIGSGAGRG